MGNGNWEMLHGNGMKWESKIHSCGRRLQVFAFTYLLISNPNDCGTCIPW